MKKLITMIALIALTATATAQVKFGIHAGTGIGLMSKDVHDADMKDKTKPTKSLLAPLLMVVSLLKSLLLRNYC